MPCTRQAHALHTPCTRRARAVLQVSAGLHEQQRSDLMAWLPASRPELQPAQIRQLLHRLDRLVLAL